MITDILGISVFSISQIHYGVNYIYNIAIFIKNPSDFHQRDFLFLSYFSAKANISFFNFSNCLSASSIVLPLTPM